MAVIHNTANSYVCFPKAKTDSTSAFDARDTDADNVCPFVRDDSKSPITLFGPNNELLTTSSPQGPMSGHMVLCLEKNFKGYCAITNHLNMCANFPDKYFHKTSSIFQIEGEGDIVQCFYYETANCKGKNAFGGVDSTYFRMQARDLKRWDKKLGSAGCQKDLGPPSPLIEQNWDREASLRRGFWRREG
ncbi:hypothetical protein BU24DRAFT_429355 [Aaosphaeria arxii CBS 175.79]|uniref:Uncharacterized protein n=1 Tax=Aaosphaeria arxii CBS 175.79 TaxID=1450172 RepID=A0A6A5X688_9PLEO|nr:uncharacterized protein BU24DRAFT_429355 [Aaosphaeria arxii CBS 175.79]KAF2008525.1 hypothetical protein BU24DRAFT_429355 [Aaosphaeria arxii CBS 175.79]